MSFSDPIVFEPLPMERVWGGRRLESVLGKSLPPGTPVGESWEVVDREDAQSVVHEGPLAGATLNALWAERRAEVFGEAYVAHPAPRFPILVKILDARERLSVQVHPPAAVAPSLGGEPKTEMWYFLDCLPNASIYAGLRAGVTRAAFEAAMADGGVEHTLHRTPVRAGESIFIPSGRVHAIGEGCLIVEVQQNSDTTYRVFDWNRTGLDGRPRALHIPESMTSIDFDDFEPEVNPAVEGGVIAACEHFVVERVAVTEPRPASEGGEFVLLTVVGGAVAFGERVFALGEMVLIPAGAGATPIRPVGGPAAILRTTLPVPPEK